jgi:hypothetical protein
VSKCGKCGVEGHNARSCGKEAAPAAAKPAKVRKTRKAVMARATSVSEALHERRDALKKELETVERVLTDIEALGL